MIAGLPRKVVCLSMHRKVPMHAFQSQIVHFPLADEGNKDPTRSHGTKFGVVKLRNRLATYIEVQRFWGGSKTVMPSLQIYQFFMQLNPLFMHCKQFSKCPSINSRNCMLTKSSLLHS